MMTFHPDQLLDLSGKVYIVTGGNSGIGYHTVANLAKKHAHVYMCARSVAKANVAIEAIKNENPNANITLLEMDHLSLSSVVAAAKLFLSKESQLHGLVNNAGIMATPFEMSKDGFEAQWQTNHLAHWVLTSHLLPLMLTTSKLFPAGMVRIVNITSGGHHMAPKGGICFDDTSLPNNPGQRYGQSKLANILHARNLNGKYGPNSESAKIGGGEIWTASVHPGLVTTELKSHSEGLILAASLAVFEFLGGYMDSNQGSYTSVYCVASQDMKPEDSGSYYERIAKISCWASSMSKDLDLAAKLDKYTEDLMKRGGWAPTL